MSLPGRPKGELRNAKLEGTPVTWRLRELAATRPAALASSRAAATLVLLLALPALAADAADPIIEFTVARQDTMIALSRQVLVSPGAWREVARLNRLRNPNRIAPGQVLKIPSRLMRTEAASARIISANGEVRVDGAAAGTSLAAGQTLRTGADGSAAVELADGSRLLVPPGTEFQLSQSQRITARQGEGLFAGSMRLLRGSLEVLAAKVLRAKPLEVQTPTAVIGVRGTEYRVRHDDTDNTSRNEVLEGQVRAEVASARERAAEVGAGFGTAIDASARAPQVVPLLPAPDLASLPERFERPVLRFVLPADAGAVRVQVASDSSFARILSDQRVAAGAEVRIAGLQDGTWPMRVRRIDAQGIEGRDGLRAVVLKARPEPPALSRPRAGGKASVGNVAFEWARNTSASRYALQVARDAEFKQLTHSVTVADLPGTELALAEAGAYQWRIASIRDDGSAAGDRGPWSDAQAFELRALPAPPTGGLSEDGKNFVLRWSGRAQDRQRVELARDAAFTDIVAQAELAAPEWSLPRPELPGSYYFRYRSVEPDGFTTPASSTLQIEVPRDWRFLWIFAPLLLLLL